MATDDTDRTKRVKEARDEAKKEIEAYRKEKEDEFKKFESEVWLSYPLSELRAVELWLLKGFICVGYMLMIGTAHQRQQEGRRRREQGRREPDKGNQGGRQEGPRSGCEGSSEGGFRYQACGSRSY